MSPVTMSPVLPIAGSTTWAHLFQTFARLERVHVEHTVFDEDDMRALSQLRCCSDLTLLSVTGLQQLETDSVRAVQRMVQQLQHWSCDDDTICLSNLGSTTRARTRPLGLRQETDPSNITAAAAALLERPVQDTQTVISPSWQHLSLQLSDDSTGGMPPVHNFAFIITECNLRSLSWSQALSPAMLHVLSMSVTLEELDLCSTSCNRMTSVQLSPRLRRVHLEGNFAPGAVWTALSELQQLEEVSFTPWPGVRDAEATRELCRGAVQLVDLPKLRLITICDHSFTLEAIRRLYGPESAVSF